MRDLVIGAFPGPGVPPDPDLPRNIWPAPPENGAPALCSAAVLVPLVDHAHGMTVILTQRTDGLPSHAGQVSFPGGRRADGDATPEDTALRETEEEIGLARERVELVGRMNAHDTSTGYRVVPVVGLVSPPVTLVPDPSEVAHAFEIPVAHVLDPANHRFETRLQRGTERQIQIMAYGDYFIWGLTARVLGELARLLRR